MCLVWVVNAYTLFLGGFLLLGGRLADLLGRRRVFLSGLILFSIASLFGGLAESDLQLIIARAVQGLGAALLSPAALSILTTTFEEGPERIKALGVWGAVAGSGGAVGVLLGGPCRRRTSSGCSSARRCSRCSSSFRSTCRTCSGSRPSRPASRTCRCRRGSSCRRGVASQLVTRMGVRPVLTAGLLLLTGGLVWFGQVSADCSYVGDVLFPSLVAALGLGFSFVPVMLGAVAGTKPNEAGLASGLINTSQQVGGALGLAILSTIAFDAVPEGRPGPVALTEGFQSAFLVGAAFALAGAAIAILALRSEDDQAMQEAAAQPAAA